MLLRRIFFSSKKSQVKSVQCIGIERTNEKKIIKKEMFSVIELGSS